ncbi:hypothetical protein PIB30_081340, partial [Stylosanthes scabra]|nr:hypothetical protein [Stylosanthes scabra]
AASDVSIPNYHLNPDSRKAVAHFLFLKDNISAIELLASVIGSSNLFLPLEEEFLPYSNYGKVNLIITIVFFSNKEKGEATKSKKCEELENILSSENIALDERSFEEELQNAIVEENYAKAAKIWDTLKNLQKDSKTTIFGINSKFYESFGDRDLAAMQALCSKKDEVCYVHLDLKWILGYDDVIESCDLAWSVDVLIGVLTKDAVFMTKPISMEES